MAYDSDVKESVIRMIKASTGKVKARKIQDALYKIHGLSVKTGFIYQCIREVNAVVNTEELWHTDPDTIPDNAKIIGFITDTHLPAEVPGYLEWVASEFKKRGVNTIIHGGDIFDYHAASFHDSEDDAYSGIQEVAVIEEKLKEWVKVFPHMRLVEGNHDAIPSRKAKKAGLAGVHIKTPHELYKCLPTTWKWVDDYYLIRNGRDGTEFAHGINSNGMYGAINTAQKRGGSFCQGHTHGYAGVLHRANNRRLFFGLNGGCGFDTSTYAARYSKHYALKGVVGASVIYSDTEAEFFPMKLGG